MRELSGPALALCLGLAALAATPSLLTCLAAPVPFAKPKTSPPPLEGEWGADGRWGCAVATRSRVLLAAGGRYAHHVPHDDGTVAVFLGTWHVAGDGSLVVRERLAHDDGTWGNEYVWSVPAPSWCPKARRWTAADGDGDWGPVVGLTLTPLAGRR